MIYGANEAPSTEVIEEYKPGCDQYEAESQEKLQVKQITSTGTTESTTESTTQGPNGGPNENTDKSTDRSANEDTKKVIEFKNQAIERDIKAQLEL